MYPHEGKILVLAQNCLKPLAIDRRYNHLGRDAVTQSVERGVCGEMLL